MPNQRVSDMHSALCIYFTSVAAKGSEDKQFEIKPFSTTLGKGEWMTTQLWKCSVEFWVATEMFPFGFVAAISHV